MPKACTTLEHGAQDPSLWEADNCVSKPLIRLQITIVTGFFIFLFRNNWGIIGVSV